MTDQKILVFGSFTEDEIKSLQRQRETDSEIKFGSLDSVTLRSVGILSKKLTDVNYSKGWTSKLVNKENAATVCTTESSSQVIATASDENRKRNVPDACSPSCSDDIQQLKTNNLELSVSSVPGTSCISTQLSPKDHLSKGSIASSTLLANEPLVNLFQGVGLVNSKENVLKASDGPGLTKNLLPRGLVNLGNLCFLNATLQALLSCPPFVLLLDELRTRNIPKIGYPTLRAFVEFISDFDTPMNSRSKRKEMVLETGSPIRPIMFESVIINFTPDVPNSIFGRPRQEDAQEFLSFLMHQMHDELLKLEGQIPNSNGGRTSLVSSNNEDDDDNWETVGPKNRTAITRIQSFIPSKLSAIFGGQLKSVVKARGSKASATIQPFLLLHLNICPEPVCSIEDALHLFSAPETLEGYRTSAAGKAEVVNASKSVRILELSEILVLHLMRFSYGSQGSTKLNKPVRFPLELDVGREILVSSSEGQRYELVATITHHGKEPSKGHYTADARHPNGKWLHYDDASVTIIPTSEVLHEQAYVLFYKQL